MATYYAGVDVSKEKLDVFWDGKLRAIPNEAKACQKLVKEVIKCQDSAIVVESTGGYERTLVKAAHKVELPICVIQPGRGKHFAKAQGQKVKNDRADAELLANFGQAMSPRPTPPMDEVRESLRELVDLRTQLVEDRVRMQNRLASTHDKYAKKAVQKLIETLKQAIVKIEAQIEKVRQNSEETKRISEALESASGVGKQTSAAFVAYVPELGKVNRHEIAALVGVAPFDRESGEWKGKRMIGGGRAPARRALYQSTMIAAAIGRDKVLAKTYADMVARGKPKKVALIACARKLLVYLNGIVKEALDSAALPVVVN